MGLVAGELGDHTHPALSRHQECFRPRQSLLRFVAKTLLNEPMRRRQSEVSLEGLTECVRRLITGLGGNHMDRYSLGQSGLGVSEAIVLLPASFYL